LFHKPRDAFAVFLVMEGATSLFFTLIFTVNMAYQVAVVDLNPLQLVLVGTLLETVAFLFEIPTGVVADIYSRRLSVIVGMFLIGIGFMIEGAVPRFEAVLLAQVFWGLGATFTSGATQAWIADEVGEKRAGQAFMRGSQAGMAAALVGIPLSAGLGRVDIQLPIVLGGALFIGLGFFLALVMPEAGFTPRPPEERESWRTMFHTFRDGARLVRGRTILLIFLGVSAIYGLSSEGFDRLWAAHILGNFTLPTTGGLDMVTWFGIIGMITLLVSIASTEIVRRRVNTQRGTARILLAVNVLAVVALVVFGLAGRFGVVVAAYLAFRVLRGVSDPILMAWINPHVESKVRATVFSMTAQTNALGQIAGGPAIGLIGTRVSLRAALVADAVLLAPVLLLYARAMRQEPVPALQPATGD
jgi:DHA3 family tetracycline resistance protein-like MFS transporter